MKNRRETRAYCPVCVKETQHRCGKCESCDGRRRRLARMAVVHPADALPLCVCGKPTIQRGPIAWRARAAWQRFYCSQECRARSQWEAAERFAAPRTPRNVQPEYGAEKVA